MKKLLYLLICLPLIFSSCKKEDNSPGSILGCIDPLAANYNPTATQDNASCLYSLVAIWSVDDYILDGTSLFSSSLSLYITSMASTFYDDNTSWTLAYYSDGSELNVYGTWSVIGTSTLRLVNSSGQQVDWTITKLNYYELELYSNDVGGLGSGTLQCSRYE